MLNAKLAGLTYLFYILLWNVVLGDVSLGSLASKYTVSDSLTLKWVDDGADPSLDDLSTATLLLCTGTNADIHCFSSNPIFSKKSMSSLDGEYKFDFADLAALGTDGPYFLQMTSLIKAGGYTIHYTKRFTLSGMSGTYEAEDGGQTDAPEAQVSIAGEDGGGVATDFSKSATVTYTAQTGRMRYATMQMQPGTTITRSLSPSARYPTSKVSFFKSNVAPAKCTSTYTISWSYTFLGATNYAQTMPTPTHYYAASAVRASSIVAKYSAKKKRWLDF